MKDQLQHHTDLLINLACCDFSFIFPLRQTQATKYSPTKTRRHLIALESLSIFIKIWKSENFPFRQKWKSFQASRRLNSSGSWAIYCNVFFFFLIPSFISKGVPAICALSWSIVKITVSYKYGMHEAEHQVSWLCFNVKSTFGAAGN